MTVSTGEQQRSAIPADTFAVRLMLVRVHAGYLTIEQAAERSGLNYGSWSNWERGRKPRDMDDVVDAISETFGIDPDWLMWGGALTAPERRRRRLPAGDGRNTLRYASMPERMRRNVRPTGRNQDNRAPSSRRPRIMPRPLNAVS